MIGAMHPVRLAGAPELRSSSAEHDSRDVLGRRINLASLLRPGNAERCRIGDVAGSLQAKSHLLDRRVPR
jgi:hypothetical protein